MGSAEVSWSLVVTVDTLSFFSEPQLTPHFRIASFAVLLMACLSRDFRVWKKLEPEDVPLSFFESEREGLLDRKADKSDSEGALVEDVSSTEGGSEGPWDEVD